MASLCDTTCGAAATAPTPYDADCSVVTAKAGAEYFFTLPCDETLDMTDSVAVAAAITANTVQKSPRGKLTIERGDETIIEDAFGCGDDINLGYNLTLNFETYQAESANNDDDTYWAAINDDFNTLRFFWVTCSGKIFYAVGDANPGFKVSLVNRFLPEPGDNNFVKWTGSLEISDLTVSNIPLVDSAVLNALGVSVN